MSTRIDAIGQEDTNSRLEQLQQEQILKAQQAKAGTVQEDGTKVEDPSAIVSISPKTDTIEISGEGRQALAQAKQALKTASGSEAGENAEAAGQSAAQAKSDSDVSSLSTLFSDSSSADNTSTAELASKTEQQLEKLVAEGSITRSEMDAELRRRVAPDMSTPETFAAQQLSGEY